MKDHFHFETLKTMIGEEFSGLQKQMINVGNGRFSYIGGRK